AAARALPLNASRARAAGRDRDAADQGMLRGPRRGDRARGGRGLPRAEVSRVPRLGAGQGAPGRRELRQELRRARARAPHHRGSRARRRGDRAVPRTPGCHDHDLPGAVAGDGTGEGHALHPAARPESPAEVPLELAVVAVVTLVAAGERRNYTTWV